MDKRVCRQCRKNRKMTEDFDHGWCNSCIIDLKLKNIQLEAKIDELFEEWSMKHGGVLLVNTYAARKVDEFLEDLEELQKALKGK